MMIDITKDEGQIILSCLEMAEVLYGDRKEEFKEIRRKLSKLEIPDAAEAILQRMVRGRQK